MFSKIKKFFKNLFAEKITITVTDLDIKYGHYGNGFSCPIALALKDMGYKHPVVGVDEIFPSTDAFILPKEAQKFISDFDNYKQVKPFTFTAVKK